MRSAADVAEPFLSVVVTTKDAARHLPDVLGDFERLDWPHDKLEVVLVDAFSTDGTWDLIEEFAHRAPFAVVARQKAGFIGAGRNEGFRAAKGDFVAVTDADMRVPPDWLRELWMGMKEGIGVVGGPNETHASDLTSRAIAAIPTHGPSVGSVPVWGLNPWLDDYVTDRDVYGAVTRNSLFRKAAFVAAGGFDESLRVTEDPELNYRILQTGFKIRYRRRAGVRHVHRDTLRAYFRQQRLYAYWQAHVNRKHAALRRPRHAAPAWALALTLLSLLLVLVDARLIVIPMAAVILGLLASIVYSVRAARIKRDAALALALPFFFLLWQLAWVVGYPSGALRARRPA